jgi:hypothetical protein
MPWDTDDNETIHEDAKLCEAEAMDVLVYLREMDAGTDVACWVVCAKGDLGAVPFVPLGWEPT